MSGAHYDVIMLVGNMQISSVLVQSLILNQSKVFLAAQGFFILVEGGRYAFVTSLCIYILFNFLFMLGIGQPNLA